MENKKNSMPSVQQILLSRLIMMILVFIIVFAANAQPGSGSKPANEVFAGISAAGKAGNFNYGANFSFTHPLTGKFRLMGDAGFYLKKNGAASLKQFQLLGGVEMQPLNADTKISLSPHLLLGTTCFNSKYKFETMAYSNNQFGISMAAGTNILFPLNDRIAVAARIDYTPTLLKGALNHDFRFGMGIRIKFNKEEPSTPKYIIPNEPRNEFISMNGYDFDKDPKLYGPDDDKLEHPLANPKQTQGKECKGIDVFDYYNNNTNPVAATLIIRETGLCNVHVTVEQLEEIAAENKDGSNKEGGKKGRTATGSRTTTRNKGDQNKPKSPVQKDGKWKKTKLFEYDAEPVQGDDVYSFLVPAKTRIRVTISCGGKLSDGDCDFLRKFVVTEDEKIKVENENSAPKLELAPPKALEKLDQFDPMRNRCISVDHTFYKITNRDVKQTMTIHFKAVSECGCYFEAYANEAPALKEGMPEPLEGGKLGVGHKDESPKIAKPVDKGKVSSMGTEQTLTIRPGKEIYFKGRCPLQQPMPGPCKGRIEITGITFTSK